MAIVVEQHSLSLHNIRDILVYLACITLYNPVILRMNIVIFSTLSGSHDAGYTRHHIGIYF